MKTRALLMPAILALLTSALGCQSTPEAVSLSTLSDAGEAEEQRDLWRRDPHGYIAWRREHYPEWAMQYEQVLDAYDVASAVHERRQIDHISTYQETLEHTLDLAIAGNAIDELEAQLSISSLLRQSGLTSHVHFQKQQAGDLIHYRYIGQDETHTVRSNGQSAWATMPVGFCFVWVERNGVRSWRGVGPFLFVRPEEGPLHVELDD